MSDRDTDSRSLAGTVLRLWPVVTIIGVALLAVQIAGGAYQAEFTGHPDEPAQFVSGLMLYDYLTTPPRENPIQWAGQYYLHYPKVAIGHWPPGFHILEALWWLLVGPSRTTAILLQWLIGVVALTVLYRVCRSMLSLPVTIGILAFTIATPVFQLALERTMADLSCFLCAVLLIQFTVRLLEKQDRTAALSVALTLLVAALIKGTAICLAPVPILALLASGHRIRIPRGWLITSAVGLLGAIGIYLAMGDVRTWGGITLQIPWPGLVIVSLAGWGFLAVGVLGIQRKSLALVAASVVISALGVSYAVRAMQEPRHWIIALPGIFILTGLAVERFRSPWIGIAILLPAVYFFPQFRYSQSRAGYGDLLRQVAHPSRMLVSSSRDGEGPWIAVVSLAEKRPSSFVVRASKVLAEEGWNGENYRLLTTTPDEISRRLDELALDVVILHAAPNPDPPPHHALLERTVHESNSWRSCASAQDLQAYCRVVAPQVPRQPLKLNVQHWTFEEQIPP